MTQGEFIDILFDALMFSSSQRRAWLAAEYGRKYADELTTAERSRLIDRLRKMRDDRPEPTSRFKREEDYE